ncbi:DUF4097 family beta strand repeat-containing protein [[Clostridium] dakarense]|uniref:DUF4097 family beta strand repeat-containing protein n=1 Tax=Faecalimicrobium dakarense TaxID=1301100 RepID=UPI0004B591DF|nr:DUF4097 family beta strand repeat-containing protein [[Clostridium] dakarense]
MGSKNAKLRLVIWSIITVILISLFVGGISLRNGDNLGKTNEWTVKSDSLKNIKINLTRDDLVIKTTKDKDIKIVESSNYKINKREQLNISEENNSLNIYRDNKMLEWISFGRFKLRRIEIYIPENYKENLIVNNHVGDIDVLSNLNLENFEIYQNVGDLNIEGDISCNSLSAKLDVGNIDSRIINTKEYKFKASVGDIDIKGISGKGSIKSNVGDVRCEVDKIGGNIDIKSNVGDVDLYISENLSFDLDAKSNVGEVDSNFQANIDGKRMKSSVGTDISGTVKVKSDVGDISINKK